MINKEKMLEAFKYLGKPALAMNHYELETACVGFTASEWKEFLQLPETKDYIDQEMAIIRNTEINRLVQGASGSRSVGQAQLISALTKIDDDTPEVNGPIFIYCHVPLNEQQQHAPNVKEVDAFGLIKPDTTT